MALHAALLNLVVSVEYSTFDNRVQIDVGQWATYASHTVKQAKSGLLEFADVLLGGENGWPGKHFEGF